MNLRFLMRIGRNYLWRHKVQSFLMILGISLGVSVAVAIDLANESSRRALSLSAQMVTGKATHQITSFPGRIPAQVFTDIRKTYPTIPSAPIVSQFVTVSEMNDRPLELLGVDPLSENSFRNFLVLDSRLSNEDLVLLFSRPDGVLISKNLATEYGLKAGDNLTLSSDGFPVTATIIGVIESSDTLTMQSLDGILLADIAAAQALSGRLNEIDRVDLILPDDQPGLVEEIGQVLPDNVSLTTVETRQQGIIQLTEAFQTNLTALSLLALTVGMFLIYNTMTFSVVQRRKLFGVLRSVGVTRRELFLVVLLESGIIGLLGSVVGVGLGVWLGRFTISMVSQTVNDLYFTTTVRDVVIPSISIWKGFLLGILASLSTAIPPAWEAASVQPREAISRYNLENKTQKILLRLVIFSMLAAVAGFVLIMLPSKGIWIGFGGLFAVVLGFALITAPGMVLFLRLINPILQRILGIYGRMAPRNLINTLSRTSVAVAALMISVSVSIGVTLMIDSFRYTVSQWLQQSLSGDIYITSQNFISTLPAAPIDPAVVEQIKANSKVSRVDVLKNGQVPSPAGVIQVSATDNYSLAEERVFKFLWVSRDDVWRELQNGAVIVTEPLSIKMGLEKPGQSIILTTSTGDKAFPVVGVYHDYSSSSGSVQMDISLYRKYWNDPDISAMGVRLKSPVEIEKTISEFYETLQTNQLLYIRANSTLRDEVMTVFDRTFAITRALQILATLVAFVGILSALSLLQYEKQREVGIIRALGFTSSQLWRLMMLETGLMGLIAGFFAMPTGYTLALILIEVINQRSFGWSINLYLTWQPFIQALAVSLTASLLAGILPSRKISKMQTIEAIRYE